MAGDLAVLRVLLYGEPIGTLTRFSGDRTLFAFTDAYVADDNRPTLSLAFKSDQGSLISDFNPVQTRVMPFFSNLLPEGTSRSFKIAEFFSIIGCVESFFGYPTKTFGCVDGRIWAESVL